MDGIPKLKCYHQKGHLLPESLLQIEAQKERLGTLRGKFSCTRQGRHLNSLVQKQGTLKLKPGPLRLRTRVLNCGLKQYNLEIIYIIPASLYPSPNDNLAAAF